MTPEQSKDSDRSDESDWSDRFPKQKAMTQYDLISENPESTAIAEFEAGYRSVPQ